MSTLSSTRLRASGSITGLCRLRSWVEQQNAEYDRECRGADDGLYRLDADNVFGFEQRDGGFPDSLVWDLENLFPDLTFVGETWSDVGRVWNIEIRYGYTGVWCEDEHEWLARTVDFRDPGEPVDYGSIDPDVDIDPELPAGAAPTAQILPADFIDRMMRDDTAPIIPLAL
jgi:hypothetical protein